MGLTVARPEIDERGQGGENRGGERSGHQCIGEVHGITIPRLEFPADPPVTVLRVAVIYAKATTRMRRAEDGRGGVRSTTLTLFVKGVDTEVALDVTTAEGGTNGMSGSAAERIVEGDVNPRRSQTETVETNEQVEGAIGTEILQDALRDLDENLVRRVRARARRPCQCDVADLAGLAVPLGVPVKASSGQDQSATQVTAEVVSDHVRIAAQRAAEP